MHCTAHIPSAVQTVDNSRSPPCRLRFAVQDTVDPVDYRAADVAPGRSTGPQYKGGYRRPGTWIEYAKQFADTVNG